MALPDDPTGAMPTDDSAQQGETIHHVSSAKKKGKETGVRQLNLTSMLDVCFQLLIFFVLTATFAVNEGVLPADLPAGVAESDPADPPAEPLIIVLTAVSVDNCSIWIERQATIQNGDFGELYDLLSGMRWDEKENLTGIYADDNPIIIKPHVDVHWEHVVSAFNAVIRAKYTNVSFAQAGATAAG